MQLERIRTEVSALSILCLPTCAILSASHKTAARLGVALRLVAGCVGRVAGRVAVAGLGRGRGAGWVAGLGGSRGWAAQAAQATQAAEAAQAAQALQAAQAAQGPKLTKRRKSGIIPALQYRNSGKMEKIGKS